VVVVRINHNDALKQTMLAALCCCMKDVNKF
jgi:hypothetical protein